MVSFLSEEFTHSDFIRKLKLSTPEEPIRVALFRRAVSIRRSLFWARFFSNLVGFTSEGSYYGTYIEQVVLLILNILGCAFPNLF